MPKTSLIDILEAAYDVDKREDRWLTAIARASKVTLDDGLGLFAFLYDASVPEHMTIGRFVRTSDRVQFDGATALYGIQAAGGGQYVRDTFRSLQVGAVRDTSGFAGSDGERFFDASGIGDLVVVNGLDPSGAAICLGAVTRKRAKLSEAQRERYSRIATHLANSYRLRRRLASHRATRRTPWDADAVLSPRGRMEHSATPETHLRRARGVLKEAAVAIDRARGSLRRIDVDSALGNWMGLVDGRWSLVDKFDTDGKRYVLARRNEPRVEGLALLTERERAVVAYAAMGHTNKLIAYDLGIAHSTVRVLLARAAAKLGARGRAALIAVVRAATEPTR
jgi:DNA-binding CsgD family transcriptional regulator